MAKSPHTPSPWKLENRHHRMQLLGHWHMVGPDQWMTVAYVSGFDRPESIANARLIAKAPDMYNWIRRAAKVLRNPANTHAGMAARCVRLELESQLLLQAIEEGTAQ